MILKRHLVTRVRSSKVCGNEELSFKTFYQLRKLGETNKNEP
jgi:hypothetical protein